VCDLAIGTDTGGSIRIPAAYCGVTGLKPTYGLVPAEGVFPLSPACDHAGTLTATAADGAALLAVIAGLPPVPPAAPGRVIGVLAAQLADPSVTSEVRQALDGALAALAAGGFDLTEIREPWLDELPRWEHALAVIVASEAYRVHKHRDTSMYAAGTSALLEFGRGVTPDQYAAAIADQAELLAAIDASLDGVDVLAGPTVGYCAPEQDPPFGLGDDNAEGRFTGPYNLTGHPAVSLPVPVPALPVGLQLAGRRGSDLALLTVAAAAERLFSATG
jgi:aspartyl-tRNA(Asn)/glutamyl-tRNA(Gln) amidotransferase subunit A